MARKERKAIKDVELSKETLEASEALAGRLVPILSKAKQTMKPEQFDTMTAFFLEAGRNDLFFDKTALEGFGPKIKALREFLGLTLIEFAGFLKEHPSQISMVETGKRRATPLLLLNIIFVFKISPKRLLEDWK
jgi:hypothetical protein